MTAIEIYTRPGCGYCTAAKSLLTRKKAAFTELNVHDPPIASRCTTALDGSTFVDFYWLLYLLLNMLLMLF